MTFFISIFAGKKIIGYGMKCVKAKIRRADHKDCAVLSNQVSNPFLNKQGNKSQQLRYSCFTLPGQPGIPVPYKTAPGR
jgi:hypothetical protein